MTSTDPIGTVPIICTMPDGREFRGEVPNDLPGGALLLQLDGDHITGRLADGRQFLMCLFPHKD